MSIPAFITAVTKRMRLVSAIALFVAISPMYFSASQARAEDHQSEDNPFMVDIDYTDYVSFGGKRLFKLIKNSGTDTGYRCKVGPASSANIAKVEHNENCSQIIVTASAGPFVDGVGKVLDRGSIHTSIGEDGYGRGADLVPLVVEDASGKELFKTSFSLRASNTSMYFLLRGMQRPRNSEPDGYSDRNFLVEPGKSYSFEILTPDGMPLPPEFSCSRSDRFSQHNNVNISVAPGCKLTLKDAQPGKLHVDIQKTGTPSYKDTLIFELVDAGWKAIPLELTVNQKQDGYKAYLARVSKAIDLRNIDKAKGEAYAQDDWYLNYLEQIRGELQSRMSGSGAN